LGKFYQAIGDELEIYIRHLAWLNSVPDGGQISRRDEFELDNQLIEMPEFDAGYVLEYLFELGVTMGENAVNHTELRSWMDNTGIELSAWEARIIKKLSEAYLSMSHDAKKSDSETPWKEAPHYMSSKWRAAMKLKKSIRKAAEI
jgi:hypothetical protein